MLVATSGWWELGNFDTVKRIVEELAADCSVEFGGAVLRPHSSLMDSHPEDKKLIITALREAGFQFVEEGKISPEKLDIIAKPLITLEDSLKN
jgi:hypothetical protein